MLYGRSAQYGKVLQRELFTLLQEKKHGALPYACLSLMQPDRQRARPTTVITTTLLSIVAYTNTGLRVDPALTKIVRKASY